MTDATLAALLVRAGLGLGIEAARAIEAAIRTTRPELLREDPGPLDGLDQARAAALHRTEAPAP